MIMYLLGFAFGMFVCGVLILLEYTETIETDNERMRTALWKANSSGS